MQAREGTIQLMCNDPAVQNRTLRELATEALNLANVRHRARPRDEFRPAAMQQVITYILLLNNNSRRDVCLRESRAQTSGRTTAGEYARGAAAIALRLFNLLSPDRPFLFLSQAVLLEIRARAQAAGTNCQNYLTSQLVIPADTAGTICARAGNFTASPSGDVAVAVPVRFLFSDALLELVRTAPGLLIQ